jgi:putative ABC transport system permease protein
MWNDLRYAARLLAKDRTFTVAAVLALVIGMSATTTMFTIVHGVYFRDLPFDNPDSDRVDRHTGPDKGPGA